MPLDPALLTPRGIAIIGASANPGALAHRPLEYLERTRFRGAVYPVNPNRDAIRDWPCYPSIDEVPDPVDVALISLPAERIQEALDACARRGIRLAAILSAGVDHSVHAPAGLAVVGPNSMGFFDAHANVAACWNSALDIGEVRAGGVAVVAQSGGLGGALVNRLLDRGLGLSKVVWSGEERFVDTVDYLELLLNDRHTRVGVIMVEGIRRPREFMDVARRWLASGKPLLAFKLARSTRSAPAALAHSGILAGERRVQQAAFRQCGVVEAGSIDELVDFAVVFDGYSRRIGRRFASLTTSGGAGILTTDIADASGLECPALAASTRASIAARLPSYVNIDNPLDVTAGLDEPTIMACMADLAADPSIEFVLKVNTMIGGAAKLEARAHALIETMARLPKPLVSVWLGGSLSDRGLAVMRRAGHPYFVTMEGCLCAVAASDWWHSRR